MAFVQATRRLSRPMPLRLARFCSIGANHSQKTALPARKSPLSGSLSAAGARMPASLGKDARTFASGATTTQTGRHGVAVLLAAFPAQDGPFKPLLELGGVSMVSHALWQLNSAHFETVIVAIGHQGDEVQKRLEAYMQTEQENFQGLNLKFVNLGKDSQGGRVASLTACRPLVDELLKPAESFVILGADRMFDAGLLQKAAAVDLTKDGDEACVVVESDLEGMVGIPPSTVFVATRPLHGADRIYSIGTDLETYSGIGAGMMVSTPASLKQLDDFAGGKGAKLADWLSEIAKRGTLRMLKTDGLMWFSVETAESAEFTSKGLENHGHECELADGRKVQLMGLPRKIETGASGKGADWAEFSVHKWQSAAYASKSFFQDLFVDTTDFVGKLCDELGGTSDSGPILIEVGCGTGEALVPLWDRAKYTVGMDFNPNFIEFCKDNVPESVQGNVKHIQGDAGELEALMQRELPEDWMNRPKVVICVGNTIGIMPPDLKVKCYQEMKRMAGTDGYMVVVYWNGNKFGDAVQNFYHKNPQLCGPFTGECVDLVNCRLKTPQDYSTKWTKPEEARMIFEQDVDAEVVEVLEKGVGVMVAARVRRTPA